MNKRNSFQKTIDRGSLKKVASKFYPSAFCLLFIFSRINNRQRAEDFDCKKSVKKLIFEYNLNVLQKTLIKNKKGVVKNSRKFILFQTS